MLYLYHATYRCYLDSILKYGLRCGNNKHNFSDSEDYIYLALDATAAYDYAETGLAEWGEDDFTEDDSTYDVVVLRIPYDKLSFDYFGYDWNNICDDWEDINSCIYTQNIPPNCIKIVNNIYSEPEQTIDDFEDTELGEALISCWEEYGS